MSLQLSDDAAGLHILVRKVRLSCAANRDMVALLGLINSSLVELIQLAY